MAASGSQNFVSDKARQLIKVPSLLINGNTIAVKAGEQTSTYITVPYATSAGHATTAGALKNVADNVSATAVTAALQAFWNANKSTLPRDKVIGFTSSHSGRAIHMGYFINGYDDNPYGGFFTAFYGTPYYSYASNGSFSCSELVRNDSRSYGISVTGSAGSVAWGNVTGKPSTFAPAAHTQTVATGGTGATSAAGARGNLGTWALVSDSYNTFMPADGTTNAWYKFGTAADNGAHGILPSNSGGAGSGHGYIGTSSWYWKYAYIDEIYGHLNGSCTGSAGSVAWGNVTSRPTIDKTTVVYQISRGANFDPIQSGYFAGMSTSTGITSDWWHILSMDWTGSDANNWISQLALPTQNRTGVYYRSRHSSSTYAWKKLWTSGESITNAVWNDYAECRIADTQEPGRVLMEVGDDTLTLTNRRMSHFAGVSSDTWGFLQGETDVAKTPLAVAGRTLVYPYRDRNEYKPGDCVCAAPNGTVDIMTREEVIKYPDRIVGTVSCVPEYKEWGGSDASIEDRPPIKVKGRIWIKIK